MSIDEFLCKLRDTPRDWQLHLGKIRRGPNICCPITAVEPHELNCLHADVAAHALGLSPDDRDAIKIAADYAGPAVSAQEKKLRKAVLVACGFSTTCIGNP